MIGDIAHICNRGFSKHETFSETADFRRFVESLYKFNNRNGAVRFQGKNLFSDPPPQDRIVDILKWSLLKNHYHLLLHERVQGGIVEFVKRLGNGYTKYFNIKNRRSGYLFQNSAKIIPIQEDRHFLYIPFYVELNPLDAFDTRWRTDGIKNVSGALDFLENYRWSSYRDYEKEKEFSCLLSKKVFYDLFESGEKSHKKETFDFIRKPPLNDENEGFSTPTSQPTSQPGRLTGWLN